jgi:hypothetical protein
VADSATIGTRDAGWRVCERRGFGSKDIGFCRWKEGVKGEKGVNGGNDCKLQKANSVVPSFSFPRSSFPRFWRRILKSWPSKHLRRVFRGRATRPPAAEGLSRNIGRYLWISFLRRKSLRTRGLGRPPRLRRRAAQEIWLPGALTCCLYLWIIADSEVLFR